MKWLGTRRLPPRRVLVAGVVAILLLATGLGYRWITTSTPRTAEQALAEFRAQEQAAAQAAAEEAAIRAQERASGLPRPVATPSPTAAGSDPASTPEATIPPQNVLRHPEPGVYSWATEGYEEVTPGVRRGFPSRSQRIITHDDDSPTWTSHHIYSSEHQEWLTTALSWTDQGVMVKRRVRIDLGPLTWDRDTIYTPPLWLVRSPPEVGARWEGSWNDGAGVYSGRIFERTEVVLDGELVEVWGYEWRARVTGSEEGDLTLRFWWSPQHIMTLREEGETTIRQGMGTYRSEWKIELLSLRPQR